MGPTLLPLVRSPQLNKVRSVLIDRLSSADTSALLPPVPPMPALTTRSAPASPIKSRGISTTTARSFPPKEQRPTPTPKAHETVSHSHVTSTGPAVESQRTEAVKASPVTKAEVTTAPGLPETRNVEKTSGARLEMQMPRPEAETEIEQIIVSNIA